jgi:hypothetical protein
MLTLRQHISCLRQLYILSVEASFHSPNDLQIRLIWHAAGNRDGKQGCKPHIASTPMALNLISDMQAEVTSQNTTHKFGSLISLTTNSETGGSFDYILMPS